MQRLKLNKGDPVWIHVLGQKSGELTKGTVVEVLHLDGWGFEHYVIEIPTPVDPVLVVRDGITISDDPDMSIGMWRRS